jgi:hypothetical protein
MSHPIEESYRRLEQRAAALETLVDPDTNKQITSAVQKAYGSFKACADLLLVFEDESHSSIEKALGRAKNSPTFSGKVEALRVFTIATENFPKLLESGVLLSKGKDVEAIKHVGGELLKTVIGLTVAIVGGKQIKDAAELVSTLNDLANTRQAFKFRKKQVKAASDFLKWRPSQFYRSHGVMRFSATSWISPAKWAQLKMKSCF